MVQKRDQDPFQAQLISYNCGVEGWLTPDVVESIFKNVDCIMYKDELIGFVGDYFEEISKYEESILSALRACVGSFEEITPEAMVIFNKLSERYEKIIKRTAVEYIDIDIVFNFIRNFYEIKREFKLLISVIIFKILSTSKDNSDDIMVIIQNHRDVLDLIYSKPDISDYAYALDASINDTFS